VAQFSVGARGEVQTFLHTDLQGLPLCPFLPGSCGDLFSLPLSPCSVLFLSKSTQLKGNQSIFIPWIQKQMFRSRPDTFTSSSCSSWASGLFRVGIHQLTGPQPSDPVFPEEEPKGPLRQKDSLRSRNTLLAGDVCRSGVEHLLPPKHCQTKSKPRKTLWDKVQRNSMVGLCVLLPVQASACHTLLSLWHSMREGPSALPRGRHCSLVAFPGLKGNLCHIHLSGREA
jgi:hypothetical protein